MFKKLSNLLFEDEELEEEVEFEESYELDKKKALPKEKPIEVATPIRRIDVEPAMKEPTPVKPTTDSVFAHVSEPVIKPAPRVEPVVEKAKPLGITVDELTPAAPVKPAVKKPVSKPVSKKPVEKKKKQGSVYEFRPVISPMFGVDEKDMNTAATTAQMVASSENKDTMAKVISPIYGSDVSAEPTRIQPTVEESNKAEDLISTPTTKKVEDDIPAFSLDDILNARDEEFKNDLDDNDEFVNEDLVDETIIFDKDHLNGVK